MIEITHKIEQEKKKKKENLSALRRRKESGGSVNLERYLSCLLTRVVTM